MAIAVTITPDSAHSDVQRLAGYSIQEDTGAAAHIRLRRHSVTGQILAEFKLAADQGREVHFPKEGYLHSGGDGVYVQEVSGSVSGVLYHP